MSDLSWKTGFEIELLAPRGGSRRDLAVALAERAGGGVARRFYPQSEPSLAPGKPVFHNLILGFDARDASGEWVARCVDDLTIQADLDRRAPAREGWYRIVSDDARLLSLVTARCDAEAPRETVLQPVADLFGAPLTREDDDVTRLADATGAPIAMAVTLPGERERPCELITPPWTSDHHSRLAACLAPARALGFTVPREAAAHLHFDGERLRDAAVFARLVETLDLHRAALRHAVGTNPHCLRLGPVPERLRALTRTARFRSMPWAEARAALRETEPSKYQDFNFLNLIADTPGKPTFEVRVLPGSIDADAIFERAALFAAILTWCAEAPADERARDDFPSFVDALPLAREDKARWRTSREPTSRGMLSWKSFAARPGRRRVHLISNPPTTVKNT